MTESPSGCRSSQGVDWPAEQAAPELPLKKKCFGIVLFTWMVFHFTLQTFAIKVLISAYLMNAQEVLYFYCLVGLVLYSLYSARNGVDVLGIEPKLRKVLFLRVICGSLCDVFLFMAFQLTAYSKAQCIFFTHTLMIPFVAASIIKEPISKFDVFGLVIGFAGMLLII